MKKYLIIGIFILGLGIIPKLSLADTLPYQPIYSTLSGQSGSFPQVDYPITTSPTTITSIQIIMASGYTYDPLYYLQQCTSINSNGCSGGASSWNNGSGFTLASSSIDGGLLTEYTYTATTDTIIIDPGQWINLTFYYQGGTFEFGGVTPTSTNVSVVHNFTQSNWEPFIIFNNYSPTPQGLSLTLNYPPDQSTIAPFQNFNVTVNNPASSTNGTIWIEYQQVASGTATSSFQFSPQAQFANTPFYWNPEQTSTESLPINVPTLTGITTAGTYFMYPFYTSLASGTIYQGNVTQFTISYNTNEITTSSLLAGPIFQFQNAVASATIGQCTLGTNINCDVGVLVQNSINFIFVPSNGYSLSYLTSTFDQFQGIFPFNIYFAVVGGVQSDLSNYNTPTSTELNLGIEGLNGNEINMITLTSSTTQNALTQATQTTIFGTTQGCNTSCATEAVNNLYLPFKIGIWMTAGIKIVAMITQI